MAKSKTALSYSVALLSAGFVAAGLTTAASAAQQGVTDNEIIIGQHSTLSGPVAPWGVGATNGIRMRFDEVNDAGGIHGRKIRFVVEDNQYQVPRAVQAVNKLLNRDKIFLMLAGAGTPMNNAVFKRQLAAEVPNLFPFSSARAMSEPFHRLKFAASATYYDQMRSGVKYFVEQKGKKRICSMYQDSDFGRDVQSGVVDQMKAMGMEIVSETAHKPTDTDFTAVMAKHRDAGCDLLTMGTIIRDVILPMATARKMGWNEVEFLTSIASYDAIVASAKGGATEGLYAMTYLQMPYEDSEIPTTRAWIASYKEKFGTDPNQASVIGYVAGDLTVMALDRAGRDLTTDALIEGLESIRGYRDIFGGPAMSFGPDIRKGSNEAFLAQVKDGRWIKVTGALGY
ncbi:MAG: ABC transporter substrate-binding protein [Minwuiales bacterium]|nr:ABC transporter substrate-binding protein [Minwuiales bacterium]